MGKKSQDDYDGVIYEPSDYIDPRRVGQRSRSAAGSRSSGSRAQSGGSAAKRKSAPQSQFTVFYILTLVAAVTLCIVIFLVVFNSTTNNRGANGGFQPPTNGVNGASSTPSNDDQQQVAVEETTELLGFIQDITAASHQVKILDIESGVILTLTVDAATSLTSRYGQTMLFSEFRPGDMVEISFVRRTNVLKNMGVSSESWEYRQVKDIKVDVVEQTLTHGNDTYKFGRGFMVRYKGEPYSIANVKPIDILTIRGYRDTVWAVDVLRSHGTLMLVGKDDIIDGLLEIDTDIFMMLDSFESLDLVEGERRLVIKGTNVEPFVKMVSINPGEVTTVDLADAQLKSGILRLTVNESFYSLTINGEPRSTSEPIALPYGEHEILIEKDEFEPFSGTIKVGAPTADLTVALQRIYRIARLQVVTTPPGAHVYVDEVYAGQAPVDVPVDMGLHTVRTQMEGYVSITAPTDVQGPTHLLTITLQPVITGWDTPAP